MGPSRLKLIALVSTISGLVGYDYAGTGTTVALIQAAEQSSCWRITSYWPEQICKEATGQECTWAQSYESENDCCEASFPSKQCTGSEAGETECWRFSTWWPHQTCAKETGTQCFWGNSHKTEDECCSKFPGKSCSTEIGTIDDPVE